MSNLEWSALLGRAVRKDAWEDLGKPAWDLLQEAILAGKQDEALDLLDYIWTVGKEAHDSLVDWCHAMLTYIADNFGEEEIPEAQRFRMVEHSWADEPRCILDAKEHMQYQSQVEQAHYLLPGELTVTEEEDRYILSRNPCGTGGRIMRTGKTRAPFNLGTTKNPHPWSWGKAGVPYYCTHCCIWWGIMATEALGHPVRVTEFPKGPGQPCLNIIYKSPDKIPDKYFSAFGKVKDASRIKGREQDADPSGKRGVA